MRLGIWLIGLVTILLLSGCGTTGPDNEYCLLTDYIYIDKSDEFTPRTAGDILVHNETRKSICKE